MSLSTVAYKPSGAHSLYIIPLSALCVWLLISCNFPCDVQVSWEIHCSEYKVVTAFIAYKIFEQSHKNKLYKRISICSVCCSF